MRAEVRLATFLTDLSRRLANDEMSEAASYACSASSERP